jgi:hypothetical protein
MIALAIVTLSFPADQAADALIAPLLDGVVVVPCNAGQPLRPGDPSTVDIGAARLAPFR